jgi:hypothetical protein
MRRRSWSPHIRPFAIAVAATMVAMLVGLGPAHAQFLGAEFHVNTYVTANQVNARVRAEANGDFVVVWQSSGQDGNLYGVFGQR